MKKALLLCTIYIGIITGCAKTPEDVQNRANILDEENISEDNGGSHTAFEYGSLEQIRNQIYDDIEHNDTIIKVNNTRVGTGSTMPVYNVETTLNANATEEFPKICDFIFDKKYDVSDKSLFEYNKKGDAMDKDYPAYEYPYDYDGDGKINNVNAYWFDIHSFYPDKKTMNLWQHLLMEQEFAGVRTQACVKNIILRI